MNPLLVGVASCAVWPATTFHRLIPLAMVLVEGEGALKKLQLVQVAVCALHNVDKANKIPKPQQLEILLFAKFNSP
jgi:hypothetical protein